MNLSYKERQIKSRQTATYRDKLQMRCLSVWNKLEHTHQRLGKYSTCKILIMPHYECKLVFTQSLTEANGTAQEINLWDVSDHCKPKNSPKKSAWIYKG